MPSDPPPIVGRMQEGLSGAGLSRRVRTLVVAAVLFIVLFVLAVTLPVPYAILLPGPTYNTLGTDDNGNTIIVINGRKPATRGGHLNLTTVSIRTDSVSAFQALAGWLAHDQIVVPRSAVYPPGQSQQQTNQQNTQDFASSQDDATAAALCLLGYPKGFGVLSVSASGASHGLLRPGDFFVSVAGHPAQSSASLTAVLQAQQPGATVPVVVRRANTLVTVRIKLGNAPQHRRGAGLGVVVADSCLAPFTVDLGLGNQIGGPSAGLMFALGIIDKVGPRDLTDGRFIAGTGQIDAAGQVMPIGGIALKMIAARAKGATVFLAPAGNCSDVRGAVPDGLEVVKVGSVRDAVQDLDRLERGQPVPHC